MAGNSTNGEQIANHVLEAFEGICAMTSSSLTFNKDLLGQEMVKIITDRVIDCSICATFILQFGQHIRSRHPESNSSNKRNVLLPHAPNAMFNCTEPLKASDQTLIGSGTVKSGAGEQKQQIKNNVNRIFQENNRTFKSSMLDLPSGVSQKKSSLYDSSNVCKKIDRKNQNEIESLDKINQQIVNDGSIILKFESPNSFQPPKKRSFSLLKRDRKFKCYLCEKDYLTSQGLKYHIMSHTGEKPHECNICKKSFVQRGELTGHMRTHTGEKPYECRICKKYFARSDTLVHHMSTHTGEKPHVCNICKKSFVQRGELTGHMRTHTGEKPYECSICKKSFAQHGDLTRHMRTHTGEKPYECSVCKKSFVQRKDLTRHVRTHTARNLMNVA